MDKRYYRWASIWSGWEPTDRKGLGRRGLFWGYRVRYDEKDTFEGVKCMRLTVDACSSPLTGPKVPLSKLLFNGALWKSRSVVLSRSQLHMHGTAPLLLTAVWNVKPALAFPFQVFLCVSPALLCD